MKKKLIKLFVVLLIFFGLFYFYTSYLDKQEQSAASNIQFYGNVETRQVNLAFRVAGKVQEIYVQEGTIVQKGDLIAKLEPYPYDINYALASAELKLQKVQLNKLESGYQVKEIEQAQAQVDGRRATVINLEQSLKRIKSLKNSGAVAQQEVDNNQARLDEAQAALKGAQDQLSLLSEGFRSEDIAMQAVSLELAQLRQEQAKIALDDTNLYSSLDGILVSRIVEEGSIISAGQTVFSLALNNPTWIRAYIAQPKLANVQYGAEVEITIDALPEKKYLGTIGFISPSAEFTPRSVETSEVRNDLVFRMRILVEDQDNVFRQGMPVTINMRANQALIKDPIKHNFFNKFLLDIKHSLFN